MVWQARLFAVAAVAGWGALIVSALKAALHSSALSALALFLLLPIWVLLVQSYATAYGGLAATEDGIVVTCLGLDLRFIPWGNVTKILRRPSGLGVAYRPVPGEHFRIFFKNTDPIRLTGRSIMTVDATVRDGTALVQTIAERSRVAISDAPH